jgi:hypothetical protein
MMRPSGWGQSPWIGIALSNPPRGTVHDSHCLFPKVRDPWGRSPYYGGEGLCPRVLELVRKGFCLCQKGFSCYGGDRVDYAR